jgi:cytochrome c oxidase assembly factor CtaG
VNTELTDRRQAPARPWLAAAGLALIVACLVPPLDGLARRYLFVESIQFCVFALAAPALIALGAPWRLFPGGSGEPGDPGDPGGPARPAPRLAPLLAGTSRHWASFVVTLSCLITWVVLCVFWRLPSVLDGIARHPALVLPEALTLGAAGLGLWLGLVPAPPSAVRRPRPERALVAALAMWSLWAIAYVLGFAHDAVVHAYDPAGSHLGPVADQEITAFLLWAAAGLAFTPVVFTVLMRWLKDGSEPAGEPTRPMPGTTGVRGWGPPASRGRRRTPAG